MKSQGPKYKRPKWRKGSQHSTAGTNPCVGILSCRVPARAWPVLPIPAWPSSSRSQDGSSTCKHFICICPQEHRWRGKAQGAFHQSPPAVTKLSQKPHPVTSVYSFDQNWPSGDWTRYTFSWPVVIRKKAEVNRCKRKEKMDVDEQESVSFSRIVSLCKNIWIPTS